MINLNSVLRKLDFEFMDLNFLPKSLRNVLRDLLDVSFRPPFRSYYQWVSDSVLEYARKNGIKEIVELGAGVAPITRHLIKERFGEDISFVISDLNPDIETFKHLQKVDSRVKAVLEPVDFSKKIDKYKESLLVLSATFHHIEDKERKMILDNLKSVSNHIMIFEPVRNNLFSVLLSCLGFISGILAPFFLIGQRSFFRSVLWCWILPIAPLLFVWDGCVSSLRCWNRKKWESKENHARVKDFFLCSKILISGKGLLN